jgi:hypothetical protein
VRVRVGAGQVEVTADASDRAGEDSGEVGRVLLTRAVADHLFVRPV